MFVLLRLASSGQEFRSTISGAVTDPAGASVPNASVLVTETHTGTKIQTKTDSDGRYNAPFLLPGDHEVDVRLSRPKKWKICL